MKRWAVTCAAVLAAVGSAEAAPATVRERAERTVLPAVRFRDTGVEDVLASLAEAALAADPDGTGINIIYRRAESATVPRITLSLRNISLYDAIRYVTEVAGLHFRIDENAVVISSDPLPRGRIITRIYPVQPNIADAVRRGPKN